jgi:hypothetical protein
MKILRLEFRLILMQRTALQMENGIVAMIKVAVSACETVVIVMGSVIRVCFVTRDCGLKRFQKP